MQLKKSTTQKILLVGQFKPELISFISSVEEIQVVGHLGTGENAVNSYDEFDIDLILMDIAMSGISGIEAARWIKEQNPNMKIVLLAEHLDYTFLMACINLKLDGCMLKPTTPADFVQTLISCSHLE